MIVRNMDNWDSFVWLKPLQSVISERAGREDFYYIGIVKTPKKLHSLKSNSRFL